MDEALARVVHRAGEAMDCRFKAVAPHFAWTSIHPYTAAGRQPPESLQAASQLGFRARRPRKVRARAGLNERAPRRDRARRNRGQPGL